MTIGMKVCPSCKGARKVTIETTTINPGTTTVDHITVDCVICNGTGEVTPARFAAIQSEAAMWCSCGNDSGEADYHADTRRTKHHWTCRDCGKVLQVG
jgi:Fe2+ or Zn2+ uptake regulation protein